MKNLSKVRFDALAGYSRSPYIALSAKELEWYEEADEKLLGVVCLDVSDRDYVWTVLARDAKNRFRAVDLEHSIPTQAGARERLAEALARHVPRPAEDFYQGDEVGPPVDFFTEVAPADRQHQHFRVLLSQRNSPARALIQELMHHFNDVDGNFVEQFQSTAFDSRLWELYLFALLTELAYGIRDEHRAPDFHCVGLRGDFFVEATTVNPSHTPPVIEETNVDEYFAHYVPIKYGSALFSKLNKRYWELPHVAGHPLVLAIQDFHAPHSMVWSNTALVEYLYGIRQTAVTSPTGTPEVVSQRIDKYVWRGKEIPAGYFLQPHTEHISAVLANPSGTITKFNRMGYLAGFGKRSLQMLRAGYCYRNSVHPETFAVSVDSPEYTETWCEGVSIYHNPNARIHLSADAFPGAAHHTARDGKILTNAPPFFPIGSTTFILEPR